MQSFERSVGATADANEISYVAAIHQGTYPPRPDGTITASDIQHFLLSRYGIQVEEDQVQRTIIKGYGGADTKEECIDLAELTATILIPYLFKATRGLAMISGGTSSLMGGEAMKAEGGDRVLGEVLKMILGDVTGSTSPVVIDRSLVRRILSTYGEAELARDSTLVDDMVAAATGGQEGVLFDEKALAQAVAGDIQKYPVDSETTTTTNYCDVFPDEDVPSSGGMVADEESPESEKLEEAHRPDEVSTANGIDFISDTHRSKLFVVILWAFFILTQTTYLPRPEGDSLWGIDTSCEDPNSFTCVVSSRIIRWLLIALFYSIGGTLFITAGSWGNSFEAETPWPSVASIVIMLVAAILPVSLKANDGIDQDYSEEYLYFVTLSFGGAVVVLQLIYLLGRLPKFQTNITNSRGIRRVFAQLQTGNVLTELFVKEAAAKKTRLLVCNALGVHGPAEEIDFSIDKSYSQALLNFGQRGEELETCGGVRWTWHQIRQWKLSKTEGVLIPSKLLTANLMQLIMSAFVTVLLVVSTKEAAISAESFLREQDPDKLLITDAWLSNLVEAIRLSGYIGAGASLVVCLALTLAYIPSTIRTVLQFRCGVLESLEDVDFSKYTAAPDSTSKVPGSCMWAIFHAGIAVFFVFAVVTFFFSFDGTRNTAYNIVAQIIGFLIPTIFKLILLNMLRNRFYAGHYRKKPVSANFLGLALQCLDYGLAFGYMLLRAVKLVLVPVYYIGRVDTPVFAPQVGRIGPLIIDDAPIHFRKLIISHEAHRHPYIETLGKMYLLKLRHGEQFAKTSGSRWRMIFVSALMPWMRRHRVIVDADDSAMDRKHSFASEIQRSFRVGNGKVSVETHNMNEESSNNARSAPGQIELGGLRQRSSSDYEERETTLSSSNSDELSDYEEVGIDKEEEEEEEELP